MTTTTELNSARRKLCGVLGDKQRDYFNHMKSWFRKRTTKEEFDIEARKLLSPEHGYLHNEFLLAILNKCQTLASFQPSPSTVGVAVGVAISSGLNAAKVSPTHSPQKADLDDRLKVGALKYRNKSNRTTFDHLFQPVSLAKTAPDLDEQQLLHQDILDADIIINYGTNERDGMLPDPSLIQGRLLVAAWEEGLEGGHTDPEVINLICLAAEHQVRSIIMALLMDKRGFRLKDKRTVHAIGIPAPDPWLSNTRKRRYPDGSLERISDPIEMVNVPLNGGIAEPPLVPSGKPSYLEAQHESMVDVACSAKSSGIVEPLSLYDLMTTMQKHKRLIPSHSVYALNMERIISRLYHKSRDDI